MSKFISLSDDTCTVSCQYCFHLKERKWIVISKGEENNEERNEEGDDYDEWEQGEKEVEAKER